MKAQLFITTLMLMIMGGCSSGGGSALPQASIPAPADDCGESGSSSCVTISSPDSEGFVTITGAEGAVPASATIEIRTSSSTSLLKWLDHLSTKAYATTCESDLPECSLSGATEDCHTTADSDGSFVVRIEAEVDETLSITYFDPDTCDKSEAFEESVTSDLVTLEFEGVTLAYNQSIGIGYVLGYNASTNIIKIATLSISEEEIAVSASTTLESLEGTPLFMDKLSSAEKFLIQTTNNAVLLAEGDSTTFYTIKLDNSVDQIPEKIGVQKNFSYLSISDSSSDCTVTSGKTDRLFMPATAGSLEIYPSAPYFVLDPQNSTPDSELNYYGNPALYNFAAIMDTDEALTLETVDHLYIAERGNQGYFIGDFSDGNKYLIEISMARAYCTSTTISGEGGEDLAVIRLPSELTNPGSVTFLGDFNLGEESGSLLLIPHKGTTELIVVNPDDGTSNTLDVASDLGLTSFTSVYETVSIRMPSSFPLQYALLGDANSLSILGISEDLTGLAFDLDFNIGINPVDVEFVTSLDLTDVDISTESILEDFIGSSSLLVLSGGGDDDGFSFLRLVPLSETE